MVVPGIIITGLIIIITALVLYLTRYGASFRPVNGKWYKNKRTKIRIVDPVIQGTVVTVGWETRHKNCYVKFNGRWKRGSFKRTKNRVVFVLGWKYSKHRVKTANLDDCRFFRGGPGGNRTYRLIVKNGKE